MSILAENDASEVEGALKKKERPLVPKKSLTEEEEEQEPKVHNSKLHTTYPIYL